MQPLAPQKLQSQPSLRGSGYPESCGNVLEREGDPRLDRRSQAYSL